MKFIPLVWAGIRRKQGRSILIFVQVVVAFTLFGVLQGLTNAIQHAVSAAHADRMYVASRVRMGLPLPISLIAKLQSTPGVLATVPRFQFGGQYQSEIQFIPFAATDVAQFLRMYPELEVDPAQIRAMTEKQDGAIVGDVVMRDHGWKVGQRVALRSPMPRNDGSHDWPFEIVGTVRNTEDPSAAAGIFLNYRYVNESMAGPRDTFAMATVRVDPKRAAEVRQAIDGQFANSPYETLTQTERELAEAQASSLGTLDVVAHRVTIAALCVLLFATGTLMMQSIRERTPELGVLKALGFSDRRVMLLILSETVVLCIAGAVAGLLIAARVLPLAQTFIRSNASIRLEVIVAGLLCALLLALVSGAVPAWRSLQLRVAEALAHR